MATFMAGLTRGEEAEGAQSSSRALRLLRLLGEVGAQGAGLSALVELSGLSKPTCRRLLMALIAEGMAQQDAETRRYFLGREIYLLGMVAAERHGVHRIALESVARLAQQTGDAAFLQMRHGDFVICLAREDGDFPLRSHVLKAGDRHRLGVGAGPLAILAALPENEAQAFMAAHEAELRVRHPAVAAALRALVVEARARGYAMNRGLVFPGSWGMGMAVRDPSGRADACLSLAAIEGRMQPEREAMLAALLAEEVTLVERRLAQQSADAPAANLRPHPLAAKRSAP
jgi:DNA-binding IclR family transcriptional regulator